MADDKISELASASDEDLMKSFGLSQKLDDGKQLIGQLNSLPEGDKRKAANQRVQEMLTPSFYPGELRYIYEQATSKPTKNGADMLVADGQDLDDD